MKNIQLILYLKKYNLIIPETQLNKSKSILIETFNNNNDIKFEFLGESFIIKAY